MDLLKTILLYLTMVFVSSVQMAPEPSLIPDTPIPAETVIMASITPTPSPSPTPVPTPNITPNNAYKTVKVGDRGDEVGQLQRRLGELGYYIGEIDSAFGNQTRRAVESFQYQNGLSVDGIAGKRTLTVLFESDEVVSAPLQVTPAPENEPTAGPTTAITTPPPTETPAPTFVPAPTVVALETITATPLPTTEEATASLAPLMITTQDFVLSGTDVALTVAVQANSQQNGDSELQILHPLQVGDQVYVPLLEILRQASIVVIPGVDASRQEYAYSILDDVYQLSYEVDGAGIASSIIVQKNMTPQVMSLRSAFLLEGILYLPMTVVTELMQISFTLDDQQVRYSVTMPASEVT